LKKRNDQIILKFTNSSDEGFNSSLKAFLEEQKNVAYPKPTKDKDIRINVDFKSEG
jgi:hypothetical protein